MTSAFTADSRTLEQLLAAHAVYRVPDYQRAYSWTTKEAGQLIDDLMIACGDVRGSPAADDGYFLGAVLLMELEADAPLAETGERQSSFDIVDGQQRLITLTILLCVLRDVASDRGLSVPNELGALIEFGSRGDGAVYRVVPRGSEGVFLATYVQHLGAALEMPDLDQLTEAQSRILAVRELFAEILFNLDDDEISRFAGFLRASCHFAVVTTRSIDRAHRIFSVLNERGRPLARNDIIKAHVLGGMPPSERAGASARWTAMETLLRADLEELFSHIRAIEAPRSSTIIAGIRAVVSQSGGSLPFFGNVLEPYARIFGQVRPGRRSSDDLSPTINRYLTYLGWFGSAEWVPVLMAYWRAVEGDVAKLEAFLVRFDRLVFGLRFLGVGADKRVARFAALLQRIRNSADLDAPDSPFGFSREEVRNIFYNLRGIHTRSQLTCKLLLLRLNDELAGGPQRLDPSDYTVEHVLPQKPGRNSQWRLWYPLADDRDSATQSLGNLVLVSREQNDRARNMELPKKLEVYFGEGQEVPHITRELLGVKEWRKENIAERELRLLSLIHRLWGFEDCRTGSHGVEPFADQRINRRRRRAADPD